MLKKFNMKAYQACCLMTYDIRHVIIFFRLLFNNKCETLNEGDSVCSHVVNCCMVV